VVESIVYRSIVVSQWRVLHTGCVGSVLGDRRLGPCYNKKHEKNCPILDAFCFLEKRHKESTQVHPCSTTKV
jgi:hypothetical protein